jgi:hypothetical protein
MTCVLALVKPPSVSRVRVGDVREKVGLGTKQMTA